MENLSSQDYANFDSKKFRVENLSSLPTAGNKGRLVCLTSDNCLYFDNGTAWIKYEKVTSINKYKTETKTASGTTVYTDSDLTFEIGAFEKWQIHCQLNFYVPANQELYVRLKDYLLDSDLEWRGNWYDRTTSGTDAGPLIAVPDITIGGFGGSMIYTPIASDRKIAIIIDGVINASFTSTPSTIELDWSADTGAQLLKYSTMSAVRL
ncbi:MAG: hypothetical protein WC319_04440 [Candidatus Paceibacterota bacterium]|jgi:hypothetical protein